MAGLLAANMLRRHNPLILERQSALPNNHHAVLRFRDEGVSQQLHIPFRAVKVFKSCDEPDPVKAMLRYSNKVLGRYEARSLINLEPVTRYIAPVDLVSQMAEGLEIHFSQTIARFDDLGVIQGPKISTIPMYALMDILGYPGERPDFQSEPGWTVTATIPGCDVFVTRYVTKYDRPFYRISITGDKAIIEGTGEPPEAFGASAVATALMDHLAISYSDNLIDCELHQSPYAKIAELSPADRRKADDFMLWATLNHGIYSLGRFATWRRSLLLDHLVGDILKIERWMTSSHFDIRKSI